MMMQVLFCFILFFLFILYLGVEGYVYISKKDRE